MDIAVNRNSSMRVPPKHIQNYYTYEWKVRDISANIVIHRNTNIRKTL